MATYVILPGATAGGWYMKQVAQRLQNAGHEVFTPTYTGLGERSHLLNPDVDLETHILDTLQVFKYENLEDVILVGKSYSGMIVTAVVDRIPQQIRHLVYLDAAVPQNGESLLDLLDPAIAAGVGEFVKAYGDGWFLPADPTVEPRLTNHPWKTVTQPIHLDGNPAAEHIPRTYIYCTVKASGDLATVLTQRGAKTAKTKGWHYHEISSGHEPEQEKPDDVAAILLALA